MSRQRIEDLPEIPKLPKNHEVVVPICEITDGGLFKATHKINVEQLIRRIVKGVLEDGRIDVFQEKGCIKIIRKK